MNKKSVFKLLILLFTWIKITVFTLPFSFALINLKQGKFQYGYDFFELSFGSAILISFTFGLVFSVWNAFEFSNIGGVSLDQFMKPKQCYNLKNGKELSDEVLRLKLNKITTNQKRWKFLSNPESGAIKLEVKNFLGAKDVISITRVNEQWEIISQPKWKIEFIDFARNLKNIQFITKQISEA